MFEKWTLQNQSGLLKNENNNRRGQCPLLESWLTIKGGLSLWVPYTQFLNLDPGAFLRMSQKST